MYKSLIRIFRSYTKTLTIRLPRSIRFQVSSLKMRTLAIWSRSCCLPIRARLRFANASLDCCQMDRWMKRWMSRICSVFFTSLLAAVERENSWVRTWVLLIKYTFYLGIGGTWSPSLDGENPLDPQTLIKTAVRTTKAMTGVDLSKCPTWYEFFGIILR